MFCLKHFSEWCHYSKAIFFFNVLISSHQKERFFSIKLMVALFKGNVTLQDMPMSIKQLPNCFLLKIIPNNMYHASLVAQMVKNPPAMWENWKILWGRAWQPTPVLLPGGPHGQWSLVQSVVSQSDTTGRLSTGQHNIHQQLAFFCKGPDSKCFHPCGPHFSKQRQFISE